MGEKKGWNRMSFYKTQELSETFNFNKIRSKMPWKSENFILKFVNGEWWQQKWTYWQSNINRTSLILIGLFQKQTNKPNSENWLEMQKSKLNTNTGV